METPKSLAKIPMTNSRWGYVSTANLDGETNLKLKTAPQLTQTALTSGGCPANVSRAFWWDMVKHRWLESQAIIVYWRVATNNRDTWRVQTQSLPVSQVTFWPSDPVGMEKDTTWDERHRQTRMSETFSFFLVGGVPFFIAYDQIRYFQRRYYESWYYNINPG